MADETQAVSTQDQESTTQETPVENQSTQAVEERKTGTVDELPSWAQSMIKDLRSENAGHRKAKQEIETQAQAAERERLAEQGKFKELYEQAQRKIAEAETRAKQLEMQALRAKVAKEVGIPDALASRLMGETEEELEADAKTLLATLPKPQAPNINANSGNGATPSSSNGVPDKETLLALGLNPRVHLGG